MSYGLKRLVKVSGVRCSKDGVNGIDEVGQAVGFGEDRVSTSRGQESFAELLAVHGEENDADVGHGLTKLDGDVGAVDGGHGEVEEDNVGSQLVGHFKGLATVHGFAADLDVGGVMKESADDVADVHVVVGDEDALEHGATMSAFEAGAIQGLL
jgi:hypothetical protein